MKSNLCFTLIISFLTTVFSSYCGSYIPKDESTCDQFTNSSYICCFLTGNYEGLISSKCYPFFREDYYKLKREIEINGYVYKLDCGTKRGALCGEVVDPISYKDCGIYSKKGNSCCFYQYDDTANCVWLGTSDIGVMEYRGLKVICSGGYLKLSFGYLILLSVVIAILY